MLACTTSPAAAPLQAWTAAHGLPDRLALVFGAEHAGVSPAARREADAEVTVRTAPGFDSLNVATASGVVLHHFARWPCAS